LGYTFSEEVFNNLYNLVYGLLALVSLLLAMTIDLNKQYISKFIKVCSILILVLFFLSVGFRAYDVGSDTSSYYLFSWKMALQPGSKIEIFFYNVIKVIKYLDLSFTVFLLVISFIYFYLFYLGFQKIEKMYNTSILFILLIFFSMFFIKNMSINIIRQGVSLAILFYGCISFLEKRGIRSFIICSILAIISHTTSVIPILLFIGCFFISGKISIKYFYALFLAGIILSALNFGILNIAPFFKNIAEGDRRLGYLTNKDNIYQVYQVGFKPQFVVFNSLFLIISHFLNEKLKIYNNKYLLEYSIMQKYYILASFIFFMAFQIPYSDRWGLFSWFVIPLLIAPAFSKNIKFLYKTIFILIFILIYIFFQFYGNI